MGAVAVVVAAGGTLLGLELTGSGTPVANPVTSPGGGTGNSGGGTGHGADGNASSAGSQGSGVGSAGSDGADGGSPSAGASSSTTTTAPGPVKVQAICTTVSGNLTGQLTAGSCSQVPVTGGSGTIAGAAFTGSGTATISWSDGGTTTFVYTASHPASQRRKCPEGDTETTLKGSVTANHTVGPDDPGIKGPVRVKLCVDPKLDVTVAPGRAFQL